MSTIPRISFGVVVLNGEPFTRYCLRSIYPFAHQIIVVEGAVPAAAPNATPQGHSSDGTLDVLRAFKACDDPENKLTVVTAEDDGYPDGFWPGEKDEQSRAYAKRASGDYLWQLDVDEFYHDRDIQAIIRLLEQDPTITAVSFKMITFWGGYDYICDGWYLRRGANVYHRLFKWGPGYQYVTHRPPTVINSDGGDLRQLNWVKVNTLPRQSIWLYHYSLLFPKQVSEKSYYYKQAGFARHRQALEWASKCYMQLAEPFRVHNIYTDPSWLERFKGVHPFQMTCLRKDIEDGYISVDIRQTDDIERLLASRTYAWRRFLLKTIFRPNEVRRSASRYLLRSAGQLKRTLTNNLARWY